jgi:hypothetical protein
MNTYIPEFSGQIFYSVASCWPGAFALQDFPVLWGYPHNVNTWAQKSCFFEIMYSITVAGYLKRIWEF